MVCRLFERWHEEGKLAITTTSPPANEMRYAFVSNHELVLRLVWT